MVFVSKTRGAKVFLSADGCAVIKKRHKIRLTFLLFYDIIHEYKKLLLGSRINGIEQHQGVRPTP